MPTSHERTPFERDTLIFPSALEADSFRERVGEQLASSDALLRADREVVAHEVAREFEAAGHPVGGTISHPWEHSADEHTEVEQLVDVAFAKDLPAALDVARQSSFYPRNIDLLHDVLTGELYEHVRESRVNRQEVSRALLEMGAILLAALLGVIVIVWFIMH
jgi:hypothetical protein